MPDEESESVSGRTWAAAAIGLLLFAAWLMGHPSGGEAAPGPGGRSSDVSSERPPPVYAPHIPLPDSRPVRVDIPSIGLHAGVVERGLVNGAVDPPPYSTPDVAGWFGGGPTPGAAGAALLVGHVDTETRAAVFYGLSSVTPGTAVAVSRADGSVAEFTVEAIEVVDKAKFSAERVYGAGSRPELRMITCGGTFDRVKRTYSANVVVFAALTGSH
ncbi:class F sortase [Streptomyces sp. H10-C2]|uniref:class F sortase n=1 Tax=unclassified Streptomyces TaxID=2593676 RepID=UPI0024BA758D|nr:MULTISPECIES: class F sortase [unclassified Streptomyces]MDJ0339971.1 class F sortase [Streptomyces sp. PH10-H1]MDJ0369392.1 class F sortase [Streptomyces sp. H10-C2]